LGNASQAETLTCPKSVDGAYCDDGDLCNGRETCVGGACTKGTAPSCDDSDSCTTDSCAPATGCGHVVAANCCRSPLISHDANTAATALGSLPDPAFSYQWTFGDGTPVVFGASATHAWAQPGGYVVRLSVYDSAGQSAGASAPIAVTSPQCPAPPSVRIVPEI